MCEKCAENALQVSDPIGRIEMWSGKFGGRKRYFNITLLKEMIARSGGVPADRLVDIDVEEVWAFQIAGSVWDAAHLDHVNMNDPLIVGTMFDEGRRSMSVIDGIHRCARAHRDGIKKLKAIQFSVEATLEAEIPEEEIIMNEVLTELLATGATVKEVGETLVVVGGRPPEIKPDDHPLRKKFIRGLACGPVVLSL